MTKIPRPADFDVVLLDIEGTVCPISFVKDVLYPYAINALPATLVSKWSSEEFTAIRNTFPPEFQTPSKLFNHALDLSAQDVKAPYLKALQGYLWRTGYAKGELLCELFPDVQPAIERWVSGSPSGEEQPNKKVKIEDNTSASSPSPLAKKVIIYSSGSVEAQKLLFGHTKGTDGAKVDLQPLISGYFDTVNAGPKIERNSYHLIKTTMSLEAFERSEHPRTLDILGSIERWLFLSDNVMEVEAARAAGMQALIVERPGNKEVSEEDRSKFGSVRSFEGL